MYCETESNTGNENCICNLSLITLPRQTWYFQYWKISRNFNPFVFKYVWLLIIKMSNISYQISFLHIVGQIRRRSIDDFWVGDKEDNMRYVVIIGLDNNTNLNWIMSITSFLPLSYLVISKRSCSHSIQLGCDDTSPAQVTFFGKLSTQTF